MNWQKLKRKLPRLVVNIVVIAAIVIWFVPTLGLLITSFRPASDVAYTGWWTAHSSPLKFTQYTVENYKTYFLPEGCHRLPQRLYRHWQNGVPVFFAALATFGLSKLNFQGQGFMH